MIAPGLQLGSGNGRPFFTSGLQEPQVLPAFVTPGTQTIHGSRTPPSYRSLISTKMLSRGRVMSCWL